MCSIMGYCGKEITREQFIQKAIDILEDFLRLPFEQVMSRYN